MPMEIDWDKIRKTMEEEVELEFKEDEKEIRVTLKQNPKSYKIDKNAFKNVRSPEEIGELQEKQSQYMILQMVKDKNQLKNMINAYLGKGIPIKFDIKFDKNKNTYLLHKFKNEEDAEKVNDFLDDLFFGYFFENMMAERPMMGGRPSIFKAGKDLLKKPKKHKKPHRK